MSKFFYDYHEVTNPPIADLSHRLLIQHGNLGAPAFRRNVKAIVLKRAEIRIWLFKNAGLEYRDWITDFNMLGDKVYLKERASIILLRLAIS